MTDPRDQMQAWKQRDTRTRDPSPGWNEMGRLAYRTVNQLADRFWESGFSRRKKLHQHILSVERREERKRTKNAKQAPAEMKKVHHGQICGARSVDANHVHRKRVYQKLCKKEKREIRGLSSHAHSTWTGTRSVRNTLTIILLTAIAGTALTTVGRLRRSEVETGLSTTCRMGMTTRAWSGDVTNRTLHLPGSVLRGIRFDAGRGGSVVISVRISDGKCLAAVLRLG